VLRLAVHLLAEDGDADASSSVSSLTAPQAAESDFGADDLASSSFLKLELSSFRMSDLDTGATVRSATLGCVVRFSELWARNSIPSSLRGIFNNLPLNPTDGLQCVDGAP